MSENQSTESQGEVVETHVDTTSDTNQAVSNSSQTDSNIESESPVQQDTIESGDLENDSRETNEQQSIETPDWFMKDKYKSIEDQAKAAFELQKKMGKFWGKPQDSYELDGIEGVSKDDPLMQNIIPAIQELGLSQDGFKHLVKEYQNANIKMMQKFEADLKEELTVKDAATYQACDKWMNERLTPEEKAQVQNNWLMTPADFKLFNQMRLMAAPSTNVPSSTTGEGVRFESSKEVENDKVKYRREVNSGLRVPDKNYENELAQRFRDSRARELRSGK